MNPNDIAPMVLGVVFVLTFGGVLVLRPLVKRLGSYLDLLVDERRRTGPVGVQPVSDSRVVNALENLDRRLARLEERQDFTDELLRTKEPGRLESHVDRQ
jgi:hypothetical protein